MFTNEDRQRLNRLITLHQKLIDTNQQAIDAQQIGELLRRIETKLNELTGEEGITQAQVDEQAAKLKTEIDELKSSV